MIAIFKAKLLAYKMFISIRENKKVRKDNFVRIPKT